MSRRLSRELLVMCLSAFCLMLAPRPSLADTIDDFTFTGTVSCTAAPACTNVDIGKITGSFDVDVTTESLTGPWTFTTAAGTLASTQAGTLGTLSDGVLDILATGVVLTLDFPTGVPFNGGNTLAGELLLPGQILSVSGTATDPPVTVREGSTLSMLIVGLLVVFLVRAKSVN